MKGRITSQKTYRLPKRTLDELAMLVGKEVVRNTTEGIIVAVEHFATEYRVKEKLETEYQVKKKLAQEAEEGAEELTVHEGRGRSYKVRKLKGEEFECTSSLGALDAVTRTGMMCT